MSARVTGQRWSGIAPAAYSAVSALIVAGPLLGPGCLLLRDAVSTPRSYPTDAALGLGDAAPRAVPQDALLAVLSTVVDGCAIVKIVLVLSLWLAGWGAAALARDLLRMPAGPQLVAATVAVWNPYVAERLLQGHWSLLTGYAALPWIALLAGRLRTASRNRHMAAPSHTPATVSRLTTVSTWAALGGALAAAGLTPTGSLLAACVSLLLVGRRNLLGTAALWIVSAAPWLTATLLSGAGAEPSDPAGIAAFAARAEPGLGTLGSLAGLGGIWNSTAVPDSRTTAFAVLGTVILLILVGTGIRPVFGRAAGHGPEDSRGADAGRTVRRRLLALALLAVVLPAFGATGWGLSLGEFLVTKVPGAGLFRDSQKFVALAVPAYTLCAAAGCAALAHRLTTLGSHTPAPAAPAGHAPAEQAKHSSAAPLRPTDHIPAESTDHTSAEPTQHTSAEPISHAPAESTEHSSAAPIRPTLAKPDDHIPAESTDHTSAEATQHISAEPVGQAPAESAGHAPVEPHAHAAAAIGDTDRVAGGGVRAGRVTARMRWVAAVFMLLTFISLPDMAWGVGGALWPVHYPAGWREVAELAQGPGDVAVLPGGMFRRFRYSGTAPVLDPAPRMLRRDVLQTGELPVRGGVVSGEGTRAREVEQLLLHGGSATRLAELGVGWVLVEGGTPGPMGESKTTLDQLVSVYADRDLRLYRVPGPVAAHDASAWERRVAGTAHLLWAVLLFGGFLTAAASFGAGRRVRRSLSARIA